MNATVSGLMQDWPLTLDKIIEHAKRCHGNREVVSRTVEGPIARVTYENLYDRARRLSRALLSLGVCRGDRVGTLAWNTARHMEAWYAIAGIGSIYHTLNPRMADEQLVYIINHAEDSVIFVDLPFLPTLMARLHQLPTVRHIIVMAEPHQVPESTQANLLCYESLIEKNAERAAWGHFDENLAAGLCYTSGTIGRPKGVLYSHRSNFIHTLMTIAPDAFCLSARDTVMPVVSMYHANAWGLVFSAPAVGAKLVLPGPKLDGQSLYELIEWESVTFAAAVPTVWQSLLQYVSSTRKQFTTLRRVLIGGAAAPESMVRDFREHFGVNAIHAWGMTELSPVGLIAMPTSATLALDPEAQMRISLKQGRAPLGIEVKLTSDENVEVAKDGVAVGHLKVRGPFVAAGYFKAEESSATGNDGFLDTGDIGTIDEYGFVKVTDRAKDVIKSGGEWISSIEIENLACGHHKVHLAAVIGIPHPKWDERPLLVVQLKRGSEASQEEILSFLTGKIAKWWLPDGVEFVEEIPLGATGKIDKKRIRTWYARRSP